MKVSEEVGFPLVVRPSYVLGGRAMEVVYKKSDLENYLIEAVQASAKVQSFWMDFESSY